MGARQHHAAHVRVRADQLLPAQKRPGGHVAQRLGHGGGGADHVVLTPGHQPHQHHGEGLHVRLLDGVHGDVAEVLRSQQLRLNGVQVKGPQLPQRHGQHVLRLHCAVGLFLHVFRQEGVGIAEGLVPGELRLRGGDEILPLLHVMHAVQGEASALPEEGAEDLPVKGRAAAVLDDAAQGGLLDGQMPPQGGVPTADDEEVLPGPAGGGKHTFGDLPVSLLRPLGGEAAGVGQHEEHGVGPEHLGIEGVLGPVGDHRHIVDGLHAGGVVVQDDDLPVQGRVGFVKQPVDLRPGVGGLPQGLAGGEGFRAAQAGQFVFHGYLLTLPARPAAARSASRPGPGCPRHSRGSAAPAPAPGRGPAGCGRASPGRPRR